MYVRGWFYLYLKLQPLNLEEFLEPYETSMMKLFAKTVTSCLAESLRRFYIFIERKTERQVPPSISVQLVSVIQLVCVNS